MVLPASGPQPRWGEASIRTSLRSRWGLLSTWALGAVAGGGRWGLHLEWAPESVQVGPGACLPPLGRMVQGTRGWGGWQGALETIRTTQACWVLGRSGLCFLLQSGRGCLMSQVLTVERLGLQASGPWDWGRVSLTAGVCRKVGQGAWKAAPGVTETVQLPRRPGPGPGAGSSQPLAICGPHLPWPRFGAPWLGGAGWGQGLRVPPAPVCPHRLVCVHLPPPHLVGEPGGCLITPCPVGEPGSCLVAGDCPPVGAAVFISFLYLLEPSPPC